MKRREFLKGGKKLAGAAILSWVGLNSGCLNGRPKDTPKPTETPTPKRFTNEYVIEGDEEFRETVEYMLEVLEKHSPEWYEKTIYAGEVIRPGDIEKGSRYGRITLNEKSVKKLGENSHIKENLKYISRFPHTVQHIIDPNVSPNLIDEDIPFLVLDISTGLELELRASIAEDIYKEEINKQIPGFFNEYWSGRFGSAYESELWLFNERKQKVDQDRYKQKLDALEQKYFDHENKRLKTGFLDESWEEFKKI